MRSVIGVVPFYNTKATMSMGFKRTCRELSMNEHFLIWRSSRTAMNGSKVLLAIHAQRVFAIPKRNFNFAIGDTGLLHLVYHGAKRADAIFLGGARPVSYAPKFSADLSRFKAMLHGLTLDFLALFVCVFPEDFVDRGGAYVQRLGDLRFVHALLAKSKHLFPALCIDALPARYEQRLGRGSDEFIDLETSGFLRDLRFVRPVSRRAVRALRRCFSFFALKVL